MDDAKAGGKSEPVRKKGEEDAWFSPCGFGCHGGGSSIPTEKRTEALYLGEKERPFSALLLHTPLPPRN
jgi:hypothetical protein